MYNIGAYNADRCKENLNRIMQRILSIIIYLTPNFIDLSMIVCYILLYLHM